MAENQEVTNPHTFDEGATYLEKLQVIPANHNPEFASDPASSPRRGVEALTSAALVYLDQPS